MDTINSRNTLYDQEIIKEYFKVSQVIQEMQIYFVPTYIFQNSVFHDLRTLEKVLQAGL